MVQQQKVKTVFRTFYAKLHVAGSGETLWLTRKAVAATVTAVGVAVQRALRLLEGYLTVERETDGRVRCADLVFPLSPRDIDRAKRNVAKPKAVAPAGTGPKALAQPGYRNSYRIEEIIARDGSSHARARIAEAFTWQASRGAAQGRWLRELDMIDAKIGLQQLIAGWIRPPLGDVPMRLRAGVCQQAAQQLLSHLGLLNSRTASTVSFPSLDERHPDLRRQGWQNALAAVAGGLSPFPYMRARELDPSQYAPHDPRGDRLINLDPDWVAFVRTPDPTPLPLNFVGSNDVIVYERSWHERRRNRAEESHHRLYVALPLFDDVDPSSPLGQLADHPKLSWWRNRLREFHPLPPWAGRELDATDPVLLVPLEYDPGRRLPPEQRVHGQPLRRPSRFQSAFSGFGDRRVNWSLLVQRQRRRGKPRAQTEWEIHFATSRVVSPSLRPNVLGVHFGVEPIIWWALVDQSGTILKEDHVAGNAILEEGLRQKLRLEQNYQGQLRWVGERRYSSELKRRTTEVASTIVALAAGNDANLALEDIRWVDKRTGGPDANRRFSLWNYGKLRDRISWQGLERQVGADPDSLRPDPVVTLRLVSDFILRHTCPSCGACRQAGETKGQAKTEREGDNLNCRSCSTVGPVSDDHQARLVARLGAERLRQRLQP